MKTLITFGLGALTMYLLDPEQGRRRRALLRDQFVHTRRVVRERTSATARDLSNRAYGLAAEARRAVRTQLEPDKQQAQTPPSAEHLGR
jgi:hypothetical protein